MSKLLDDNGKKISDSNAKLEYTCNVDIDLDKAGKKSDADLFGNNGNAPKASEDIYNGLAIGVRELKDDDFNSSASITYTNSWSRKGYCVPRGCSSDSLEEFMKNNGGSGNGKGNFGMYIKGSTDDGASNMNKIGTAEIIAPSTYNGSTLSGDKIFTTSASSSTNTNSNTSYTNNPIFGGEKSDSNNSNGNKAIYLTKMVYANGTKVYLACNTGYSNASSNAVGNGYGTLTCSKNTNTGRYEWKMAGIECVKTCNVGDIDTLFGMNKGTLIDKNGNAVSESTTGKKIFFNNKTAIASGYGYTTTCKSGFKADTTNTLKAICTDNDSTNGGWDTNGKECLASGCWYSTGTGKLTLKKGKRIKNLMVIARGGFGAKGASAEGKGGSGGGGSSYYDNSIFRFISNVGSKTGNGSAEVCW